ncbi:ABC transporter permease [Labrys miyagiensis]|uniref:Xylose transport system permease protein XylH n=1 Tax=Labrys miyagiensis TaxID=346912 RepID=A0ABQ6CV14_9HYPH|nr:multiple monosaccharide ABC transporter permease [Labrys miyagiensis]GLS22101.1 ABC transporter permease [Labrys miyagiensis]
MTMNSTVSQAASPRKSIVDYISSNIRDYGLLISLLIIVGFFQYMTEGRMLAPSNINNIPNQNGYVIVMALGMMLVIVSGHIDLSVGSVCAFTGAVSAVLMVNVHVPWPLAAILTLAVGAVIGGVQGYFIAYLRIPSFIVTLAGMLVFRGLTYRLLGNTNVGPLPATFNQLSAGWITDPFAVPGFYVTTFVLAVIAAAAFIILNIKGRMTRIKHGVEEEPSTIFVGRSILMAAVTLYVGYLLAEYRGLPTVLIILLVLTLLYVFVTTRTVIGRRIYALGGNEKAAKLSGINTNRLILLTFLNMGVLAALAGMVVTSRFGGMATPKAGDGYELDVIAACFIGGASASGGVGKITGAVIGALLMGVMNVGMSILGLGIDDQKWIKGLVLLFAVCLDVYYKRKR